VRVTPDVPAQTVIEPKCVQLLAAHFRLSPAMTLAEFWKQVARLGGHLGRKSDGAQAGAPYGGAGFVLNNGPMRHNWKSNFSAIPRADS
jgi:hypothetical protein